MLTVALDTETTGLDIRHGCRPFMVAVCDQEGNSQVWEWAVDPNTRQPEIPKVDLNSIQGVLDDADKIIFHNTKFDVRAMESIGFDFNPLWSKVEDTLCASHVLDSLESHSLKDLAAKYCAYPPDDQTKLRDVVNRARRIALKYRWRTGGNYSVWHNHKHKSDLPKNTPDPLMPSQVKRPKDGWWVVDMWLPAAVAALLDDERITADFNSVTREYCVADVERTILLYLFQKRVFEEHEPELLEHYHDHLKLLREVYEIENYGISVRHDVLQSERDNYIRVAQEHDDTAVELVREEYQRQTKTRIFTDDQDSWGSDINTNSSRQMQFALYDLMKLPVLNRTKKELPSTDQETFGLLLEHLEDESESLPRDFIQNVVDGRKSLKMEEYLAGYQSRLHMVERNGNTVYILCPNFNQTGTGTTRFSANDPNTQNVSKKDGRNIRCVFGPAAGRVWYAIDYENIEMRILSYAAGVQGFIDIFERGESVHMAVARVLYPKHIVNDPNFKKTDLYRYTKNGNFAVPYGAGPEKADATYRVEGAYETLNREFDISQFSVLMNEQMSLARKQGYITTFGGYRLYVPNNKIFAALNYYVQGTAGLVCKRAMINCGQYYRDHFPQGHMIMNVHDEIVHDLPRKHRMKHVHRIKELMEEPGFSLGMPTTVSVERCDVSWDEGVEIEV